MKVLTLFLRYGTSKYAEAEEQLAELFYRNLPEVDREILVIDNSVPSGQILEKAPGRTVIGGDNSSWEFSGWDVGVRWFGNTLRNFDLVHLVTSAFRMSYPDYLDRFRLSALELAVDRPIVLGHIDCYNEPVQAFDYPFQH